MVILMPVLLHAGSRCGRGRGAGMVPLNFGAALDNLSFLRIHPPRRAEVVTQSPALTVSVSYPQSRKRASTRLTVLSFPTM